MFWELYEFLLHPRYLRKPSIWNVCVFAYFSCIMAIYFCHILGTPWISASSKKFQEPLPLKCLCFPIFFPHYGNSLFPYFWNCMSFCFTQNILETQHYGIFAFSPYFSRIMGIHFSHVLGIVWVSASSEIFKKTINLKCLCFRILFPYNGNPLFP